MNLEYIILVPLILVITCEKAQSGCSLNETLNECASCQERTCQNPIPDPTIPCLPVCPKRCECNNGLIRDETTGKCIPIEECFKCSLNETFNKCALCQEFTCQHPIANTTIRCLSVCPKRCECNNGLIRDETTGKCISIEECFRCRLNETLNECAHCQELTCRNPILDPTIRCIPACAKRCDCNNGLIRDESTRGCVLLADCPSSVKY